MRRLDEQHVRSGLVIGLGTFERGVQPFDSAGIGACDYQGRVILPRIKGGLHLSDHLAAGDQLFAVKMTAAFWERLVLELDGGSPGTLEIPDRALDIERVAEAVVGIHDDRCLDPVRYGRQRIVNLGHADKPDIGPAKAGIGKTCAGQVDRLRPHLRGNQTRQRVIDPRREDDFIAIQ